MSATPAPAVDPLLAGEPPTTIGLTTPKHLLEAIEERDDAIVNLRNACGAPSVGAPIEVAAAQRVAAAEAAVDEALRCGFVAGVGTLGVDPRLGVPATPQASVAAPPSVSVGQVRDPEPLPPERTEDDLAPIAPIDKLPAPPAKGRGRAPQSKPVPTPADAPVETGEGQVETPVAPPTPAEGE